MTYKVTQKSLQAQVDMMNDDLIPSLAHRLHYAYGGVKLMIPQRNGGYVDALRSGYLTKRDLSNRIDAYERGMDLC